jgi:hypothetical protein
MTITEPTTMITDYLLAGIAIFLAWQIFRKNQSKSARLWAWGLIMTAVAAIAGGTSHGFSLYLSETAKSVIWKTTVYAIGITSLLMLSGTILASLQGVWQRFLLGMIFIKFLFYAYWMISHNEFKYVIYDYAPAMLLIIVLQTSARFKYKAASAPWLISGIVVSFIAAGIQLSGFTIHEHFNHNDLYHVIQMVALYIIYRGVVLLRDV